MTTSTNRMISRFLSNSAAANKASMLQHREHLYLGTRQGERGLTGNSFLTLFVRKRNKLRQSAVRRDRPGRAVIRKWHRAIFFLPAFPCSMMRAAIPIEPWARRGSRISASIGAAMSVYGSIALEAGNPPGGPQGQVSRVCPAELRRVSLRAVNHFVSRFLRLGRFVRRNRAAGTGARKCG